MVFFNFDPFFPYMYMAGNTTPSSGSGLIWAADRPIWNSNYLIWGT